MVNDTISIIREQVHSNLNIRGIYIFVHNKSSVQCLMCQEQQRAVVPLTTRAIAKLLQFCLLSVYVQQRKNKYIYPSEDIWKKKRLKQGAMAISYPMCLNTINLNYCRLRRNSQKVNQEVNLYD